MDRLFTVVSVVAVLGIAAAFATVPKNPGEGQGPEKPKVALIVFDGGDWTVIRQLSEKDELPRLSRMMDNGIYGNFSTPRAFSPMTWTKIATGQRDEDIGVHGWNSQGNHGRRLINSRDVKNYRIWNYLNMEEVSTGVVNYMLTWPVEPVKGFLVAGTLARGPDVVYPPDKVQNASLMRRGTEWEKADYILDRGLHHKVSFLTLGFKRVDGYSHHLWKFIQPEKFGLERKKRNDRFRKIIYDEYRNLDEVVGRFGEEWNVIVVSDSGFQPEGGKREPGSIGSTNAWNTAPLLAKMGMAEFRMETGYGQKVYRVVESRSSLKREPWSYPRIPEINATHYRFQFRVVDSDQDVARTINFLEDVDYPDGSDFFYQVEKVVKESGETVIRGRYRIPREKTVDTRVVSGYINHPTMREEVTHLENAVKLELPNGTVVKWWSDAEQSGDHPPGTDGIIIASGPAVADRGKLPDEYISSTDIAPTILYMYGVPVPRSMDGEVKKKLFTESFNAGREIEYTNKSTLKKGNLSVVVEENDTKVSAIKKRLRNLGYTVR